MMRPGLKKFREFWDISSILHMNISLDMPSMTIGASGKHRT
jgi:hypothetical protein